MAWLAVDKNGTECIFSEMPHQYLRMNVWASDNDDDGINIPEGTIEKILGYKLTWDDEPIEIK